MLTCFAKDDPRWRENAASLREGILYVRMTKEAVIALLHELIKSKTDMRLKRVEQSDKLFIFCATVDDWAAELPALKQAIAEHAFQAIASFCRVIEAGLESDTSVDWVSRARKSLERRKEKEAKDWKNQ